MDSATLQKEFEEAVARKDYEAALPIHMKQCALDPVLFVSQHCVIETIDGRELPFSLWDFQREALETMYQNRLVIVLKARQLGLSWLALAYSLWLAIFQQNSRVLILCKKQRDASELMQRVKRMFDRMKRHPFSQQIVADFEDRRDSASTLDIGTSVIRALAAASPDDARSETASLVVLDEFAFTHDAAGIWQATLPTASNGGRVITISTGNGQNGLGEQFYKLWRGSKEGKTGITPLFYPWWVHPERDEAWKEEMVAFFGGDVEKFKVEFPDNEDDAFVGEDQGAVYASPHLDAAFRLGAIYDQMRVDGTIAPPYDNGLQLGIDWGLGSTHALIGWPLAGGGLYVPPGEVVKSRGEPYELSQEMLERVALYDFPCDEARYDVAGGQQMHTFRALAPEDMGFYGVNFNKRKAQTISFIRELLARSAYGRESRIIAISPKNTVLKRQLYALRHDEKGNIIKQDDHGPDALVCLAAPIANEFPVEPTADRVGG